LDIIWNGYTKTPIPTTKLKKVFNSFILFCDNCYYLYDNKSIIDIFSSPHWQSWTKSASIHHLIL